MSKELKRFEQWWDAEDDIPNNGPYTPDTPIQFAWAGWQAALAEQPASTLEELYALSREVSAEQPAQRTWVGLTDEEIDDCWNNLFGTGNYNRRNVYQAIEAKLKEKNT